MAKLRKVSGIGVKNSARNSAALKMLGDAIVARDVGRLEIPGRADADRVHRTQVKSAIGPNERGAQFFGDVRIVHPRPLRAEQPRQLLLDATPQRFVLNI